MRYVQRRAPTLTAPHRRHGLRWPYFEAGAVTGGFSISEVPTRDEALQWAAKFAAACRCTQGVREIVFDP